MVQLYGPKTIVTKNASDSDDDPWGEKDVKQRRVSKRDHAELERKKKAARLEDGVAAANEILAPFANGSVAYASLFQTLHAHVVVQPAGASNDGLLASAEAEKLERCDVHEWVVFRL